MMKRDPKPPSLTAVVPAWAQESQIAHWRPVTTSHATVPQSEPRSPTLGFLPVSEAVAILKVSPKTVRRLLARGELREVRIGRLVRIHSSELEQLIAGGCSHNGGFGDGGDRV